MLILGLSIYAWITIMVVLTMFGVMLFTKIPAEFVFLSAIAVLYLTGVLDVKEALAGFSNTSVVTIGALFVVIAGLIQTGVLHWMAKYVLGTPKDEKKAVVRLMLPVAFLSSILSNTAVVALFVNVVKMWSKKLGIAPSRLLIPLSYASGLGGICTLIGTPPNLIISGMYTEETGHAMNIFTTTLPGLFCLAVGVLSILALRRLLPDHKTPDDNFANTGDYTVEMLVPSDNKAVGMTYAESGLKQVDGGQLLEVVRFDKEICSPVPDDEPVMGGDHLVYVGQVDDLLDLRYTHGLASADHHVFSLNELEHGRKLRTAHIPFGSPLIGRCWKDSNVKGHDYVTLVAVSRHGERLEQIPSEVVFNVGDAVLVECSPHISEVSADLAKAMTFDEIDKVPFSIGSGTVISALLMLGLMVFAALGVMTLLQGAFLAALAMVLFRCCTPSQAIKSIDWSILMVFAGSVVLGTAITKTGLAELLATSVLNICGPHPLLVMIALCFVGTFITEFISNTAAGAMLFPIVYHVAISMGCDPFPFLVSLMIAVSCSFATPIGSPTHMLVYGPGGYRFNDFLRIGIWMNIIILAANILIVNLIWPISPLK